jgi:hypothetical protein
MRSFYLCSETAVRRPAPFLSLAAAVAALTLVVSGAARAADTITYQSSTLAMSGDRIGDLQIPANSDLLVDAIGNTGKILFHTGNASGSRPEMLLQWDGQRFDTIVTPASGPAGAWPGDIYWTKDVTIDEPARMNDQGNVVFTADHAGGFNPWGVFRWDAETQKITSIALKGMPATGNLSFVRPGSYGSAINNDNDIVLAGLVKAPNGSNEWGLFLREENGYLRPVLLPGWQLPNGKGYDKAEADPFFMPSLNDQVKIAFLARPQRSNRYNAYLWEYGEIESLMLANRDRVGSETITSVAGAWLNSHDQSALIAATTNRTGYGHYGLYRVRNGQISAAAVPGTLMPGGGTLATIQYTYTRDDVPLPVIGVSDANGMGQHAFLAKLSDGSTGVYVLNTNGTITPVYRSAPVGSVRIASAADSLQFLPGSRPVINNGGQVALSFRGTGGHSYIIVMTPIALN